MYVWPEDDTTFIRARHERNMKTEKNAPRQIENQDLRNVTACFAFVGRLRKPIETEKIEHATLSIRVGGISSVLKRAVFFVLSFRAAVLPWQCWTTCRASLTTEFQFDVSFRITILSPSGETYKHVSRPYFWRLDLCLTCSLMCKACISLTRTLFVRRRSPALQTSAYNRQFCFSESLKLTCIFNFPTFTLRGLIWRCKWLC